MSALDLLLDPEQQLLHDSVQRFLVDNPRPCWRNLSDQLGLAGIAAPESAGGFSGGMPEIAVVMAELGPALAGADWLSHTVATWLLAHINPGHGLLTDLASGVLRAAILCPASTASLPDVDIVGKSCSVDGFATLVAGGSDADLLILAVSDAIAVIATDTPGVERHRRVMLDRSVTADVDFSSNIKVELLATHADAQHLSSTANDMMLIGRCSEAVGLMQRMVADTVNYLGQRQQFGTSIGSFQVLRHRCADMQLALMKATALTEVAILAVGRDAPEVGETVSAACIEINHAVRIVGEGAVQLHGAMGVTDELAIGHYFKRALAIASGLGSQAQHLKRFVTMSD